MTATLERLRRRRAVGSQAASGRRPVRRSRNPRSTAPSTTTRAILSPTAIVDAERVDRRDRGADRRRGRRLHPGQRRVPDDRRDRSEGARPDGPVGRRAQGLRRRPRHLLRHGAEPRARPGPALRGARVRGRLPVEPGAPGDLRERHAAAPARGRLRRRARRRAREGGRRRDRGARGGSSSGGARSTRSSGSSGRRSSSSACPAGPFFHWRRFGKDPVYLDDPSILMPAPPPDLTAASGAMIMDGATSRRALTTAMLDLASRGPDRVPRGIERAARARRQEGRDRCRAGRRRGRGRGASPAQRAPPDRPGRGGRLPEAPLDRRRRQAVHHPGRPAQVRVGGRGVRHRPREARRRSRLVRREAEQGRRALDGPRRPGHRRRRHRHRRRAQHPDRRA